MILFIDHKLVKIPIVEAYSYIHTASLLTLISRYYFRFYHSNYSFIYYFTQWLQTCNDDNDRKCSFVRTFAQ